MLFFIIVENEAFSINSPRLVLCPRLYDIHGYENISIVYQKLILILDKNAVLMVHFLDILSSEAKDYKNPTHEFFLRSIILNMVKKSHF